MNVEKRIINLLKVLHTRNNKCHLVGQNSIRGLIAAPGILIGMNSRMIIEIVTPHDLEPGQFHIIGQTLKRPKHNGFVPSVYFDLPRDFAIHWDHETIGVPHPGKFAWFCKQAGVVPDVADTSQVLDVLSTDFKDCGFSFFANSPSIGSPIVISGCPVGKYKPMFTINVFFLSYPDPGIDIIRGKCSIVDPAG